MFFFARKHYQTYFSSSEKVSIATEIKQNRKENSQLCAGEEARKTRADVTRIPKQGYQWPHKKDLCPAKIFKKTK